jgi:HPt (histidine-containing phosphotransfer) domain-containing protein
MFDYLDEPLPAADRDLQPISAAKPQEAVIASSAAINVATTTPTPFVPVSSALLSAVSADLFPSTAPFGQPVAGVFGSSSSLKACTTATATQSSYAELQQRCAQLEQKCADLEKKHVDQHRENAILLKDYADLQRTVAETFQQLRQAVLCPICADVAILPKVLGSCGHIACQNCLKHVRAKVLLLSFLRVCFSCALTCCVVCSWMTQRSLR